MQNDNIQHASNEGHPQSGATNLEKKGAAVATEILTEAIVEEHQNRYFIDIEGTIHEWHSETITVTEIIDLGKWGTAVEVIEIDVDNNERVISIEEIILLKPGHGFAKKIRWKRGDSLFDARLDEELALLQSRFPHATRSGAWFLLPNVPLPLAGWNKESTDIVLRVQTGYPGASPYGFFVPAGLRIQGALPDNYQEPIGEAVPFPGTWGMFSWQAIDGQWRPGSTASGGSNLLNFALGVRLRLQEGR